MSLVKPETLAKYMGDPGGLKSEARMQAALDRAEAILALSLNRDRLLEETFADEMYDGNGMDYLYLHRRPVTAVTSVKEANVALTIGTDPNADPMPDIIWDGEPGRLVRIGGGVFLCARRHYKVSFTAGYTASSLPVPIVQGILDASALLLREKDRIGIQSKSTQSQVVEFVRTLPALTQQGLDPYRIYSSKRFRL